MYVWPVVMDGFAVAVAILANPMPAPPSLTPAGLARLIRVYNSGNCLNTLIFHGHGLGLCQPVFEGWMEASRLCLRRFAPGPVESLWRTVAYARWRQA